MQNAPTIVADDEEAAEHTEGNRCHGEEVHGRNRFPMVSKEGEPTFGRVRISRCSFHPTGYGSLGEIKTEHEEFPMYPRRSPGYRWGCYFLQSGKFIRFRLDNPERLKATINAI